MKLYRYLARLDHENRFIVIPMTPGTGAPKPESIGLAEFAARTKANYIDWRPGHAEGTLVTVVDEWGRTIIETRFMLR